MLKSIFIFTEKYSYKGSISYSYVCVGLECAYSLIIKLALDSFHFKSQQSWNEPSFTMLTGGIQLRNQSPLHNLSCANLGTMRLSAFH